MKRKEAFIGLVLIFILVFFFRCANKKEIAEQHYQTGYEFMRRGEIDSAVVMYALAIDAYPKHVKANMSYQDLLRYQLNREDEVLETYRSKAEKHSKDAVYQYLYARLEDDPEQMKEKAEAVIDLYPKFSYGYILLGNAYQRMGYDDDAVEAWDRAIQMDPANKDAYVSIAYLYLNSQEYDKSITYFDKLFTVDSAATTYYSTYWRAKYMAAEDKEAAKKAILAELDGILAKHPDDVRLMSSLNYTLTSMGEAERAKEMEKRVFELDPEGESAQMAAYNQIYSKGNTKERIEAAEDFLKKFPKRGLRRFVYSALFNFAQYEPSMKTEDIENIAQRWIDEYPDYSSAYNSIAWNFYLKHPEMYEKAVAFAKKGVEMTPRRSRGPVMDTYGWALVKTGRYGEAVEALLTADSLYGEPDAEVRYHLGAAYNGLGDADKAVECLVQSLALKEDNEVRKLFYEAYEKQRGSRQGADDFLTKGILAFSAVDSPFSAQDFTLTSWTGEEVTFSDHIGKVILVNFWKPG